MDELKINITKTVLTLPYHLLLYLNNVLGANFSSPFKQKFKESIDFLRTLDNIQRLGGCMSQAVLLEGPSGVEKNLLACTVSGDAQMLFFNISGSEFIDLYMGVNAAKVRELLGRAWHKTLLHTGRFGDQIVIDQSEFHGSVEIVKLHAKALPPAENMALFSDNPAYAGTVRCKLCQQAIMLTRAGYDKAEKEELEAAIDGYWLGRKR